MFFWICRVVDAPRSEISHFRLPTSINECSSVLCVGTFSRGAVLFLIGIPLLSPAASKGLIVFSIVMGIIVLICSVLNGDSIFKASFGIRRGWVYLVPAVRRGWANDEMDRVAWSHISSGHGERALEPEWEAVSPLVPSNASPGGHLCAQQAHFPGDLENETHWVMYYTHTHTHTAYILYIYYMNTYTQHR